MLLSYSVNTPCCVMSDRNYVCMVCILFNIMYFVADKFEGFDTKVLEVGRRFSFTVTYIIYIYIYIYIYI